MQRLNAIDAIAPAFTHTHALLFKPFRVGTSFKLALVSYCGFAGSVFLPLPLVYAGAAYLLPLPEAARGFLTLVWIVAIAGTLLYLPLYYLLARLQLVNFEVVVTLNRTIRPMWRRYAAKVWAWIGAKVLLGLLSLAVITPIAVSRGVALFRALQPSLNTADIRHIDPAVMQRLIVSCYGFYLLLFALYLVPKTLSTILEDFVMPFYVLEDLSLSTALQRAGQLYGGDPLQCSLYLLLKFILAVTGSIMQSIAMQFCMIPFALLFGAAGVFGWLILRSAGGVGQLLMVAGAITLALCFFAALLYLTIGAGGYLTLLLDSYSVVFVGSRYALLGTMLEPGPGGPFTPPPVFPSGPERRDSGGGPPMPMNPAVA